MMMAGISTPPFSFRLAEKKTGVDFPDNIGTPFPGMVFKNKKDKDSPMNIVTVIGAGLAGSECAWQLAQRGIPVILREMKPEKKTPAHTTEYFAELCCSNSLRSNQLENCLLYTSSRSRRARPCPRARSS